MGHLRCFLIWSLPAEVIERSGRVLIRPIGDRSNLISAEQIKIPVRPGDTVALSYAGYVGGDIGRLVLVRNLSTGDERVFDRSLSLLNRAYDVIRTGSFVLGLGVALSVASSLIGSYGSSAAALACATIIVGLYASVDAMCRRAEADAGRELLREAGRLSALAANLRRRVTTRGGKAA